MDHAPRALIAGLGLIGGSIGMALRERGWRVTYVDPHVDLRDAQRAGAADERAESIDRDADILIVATPVDVAIRLLGARHSAFTTSVASVMSPLKQAANSDRFVAGHPLAGSHERGLAAARRDLLGGCSWFLERHEEIVDRVARDCAARIEIVGAEEHDAAVALTSHLPQMLSTALAAYLGERRAARGERDLTAFAGPGLQTFLRLASSDASVWSPVLQSNRENLLPHVDAIMSIVRQILEGEREPFADANAFMTRLLAARRPPLA
ncbi:MAG TPA: prephenate dehydrogenase/arogenate dehydrogenase family protein [Thermoanaerobaculia bacterium]|nr:prephenate dehydrogenase/arogenate dehydrogenase family protein [Thermoanaerobaculia bacterium]